MGGVQAGRPHPGLLVLLLLLLSPAWGGSEIEAVRRLLKDPDPSKRAAAVRHLAGEESSAARAIVLGGLDDAHPYVREAAAGVLGGVLDAQQRADLRRRLRRLKNPAARLAALDAMALWLDEAGLGGLCDALEDRDAQVRRRALALLGRLVPTAQEPPVPGLLPAAELDTLARSLLEDPDGAVRAEALAGLVSRGGADPSILATCGKDPDFRVRLAALSGSAAAHDPERAVVALLGGLTDAVWSVRWAAAERAAAFGDRRIVEALIARLEDPRQRIRRRAHESLLAITGIPFAGERQRWEEWLAKLGDEALPRPSEHRSEGGEIFTEKAHTASALRFLGLPVESDHVAFVLDASGSMKALAHGGLRRWDVIVKELLAVLDRMLDRGPRTHVNVHVFSDAVESLASRAFLLTRGSLERTSRWLNERKIAGKTALYDGVAHALSDPEVDTVVVLSDGAPSAGAYFTRTALLREIAERNRWRCAEIDVIAVGQDDIGRRWKGALETLARENGGRFQAR